MATYETFGAGKLFLLHEEVETIHAGSKWNEGPVWLPASRSLVWSDIPNSRLMRWDEIGGTVTVYRQGSNNSNGNTLDREGRLITCEHGARRLTRTEHDGSVTVLADSHRGKPLNSPNDVVVKRDGTIWFSDPTYGIDGDYFGNRATRAQDGNFLYRLDPATGDLRAVVTDMVQPNGLAFTPDERHLLVVDSGRTGGAEHPAHIRRFAVREDGGLESLGVVVECPTGVFDGLCIDANGRIWAGTADGVHCFSPDGAPLGRIVLGEIIINLCFGGPKLNQLFLCAPTKVYRVFVRATGLNPWRAP